MIVLRNDARIARLKKLAPYASLLGLVILGAALILYLTDPRYLWLELLALPVGWILSQIGLYLMRNYVWEPRADQVLDQAVRKVARQGRMYHYLLPAAHVLLTPAGPIVFVTKSQRGNVSVEDDRWRHRSGGLFSRLFGQESLGNPTREAERAVRALAAYIDKEAPEVEEVPIGAIIVFTAKDESNRDLKGSTIPAMHYTKLRGYLRQQGAGQPLPAADYAALRRAFDKKAAGLPEVEA